MAEAQNKTQAQAATGEVQLDEFSALLKKEFKPKPIRRRWRWRALFVRSPNTRSSIRG